jgi:putative DNA primase/helicase
VERSNGGVEGPAPGPDEVTAAIDLASERLARRQGRPFPHTDYGNAERLVEIHGADLRHVRGLGWLAWDGRRWRARAEHEVMRRAKLTARAILTEAALVPDDAQRQELVRHALRSENEHRLRAMVELAASERDVELAAEDLDADPWLFNVANGTVDLRTGELGEHRREDLLTKLSPVAYLPDSHSQLWEGFLRRATGEDRELEEFLRRAVGYSLTGLTSEEVLFFDHGPGATGKTTFAETVKAAFGDYAKTADFETFLKRRGDAGTRNDVARLAGARLVYSLEVDEGRRFAEGLLKQVTGGDTIAARFLYRESFEFRPQFKLWLAANHRPMVNAGDEAMWRRILLIPFVAVIPEGERDRTLKAKLANPEELAAVLAWALRGCLEWQARGLDAPGRVVSYTAEYRAENDALAAWIADSCELDPQAETRCGELQACYRAWCDANAEAPVAPREYGTGLQDRGLRRVKVGRGVRAWRGIRVKADAGQADEGPAG